MVQIRPKNSGEKDLWKLPKVRTYLKHITVYCFKFHSRFRKQGESIQHYVAESRCLSEHCDFKDQLEDMMFLQTPETAAANLLLLLLLLLLLSVKK